ncbi:hypothetical protein [Methylobacterium sp. J-092]|uniref:hypothetical protein n=1 Tax=Methylobacterium sp. J-092 TaxID=2836667 RepID=UPI001FB93EB9|nr:hypothetical protein [Methylobacterium sp. J-092]MCJ2008669.1 hypothetical protein [Methylobacterium sp. J-092]
MTDRSGAAPGAGATRSASVRVERPLPRLIAQRRTWLAAAVGAGPRLGDDRSRPRP